MPEDTNTPTAESANKYEGAVVQDLNLDGKAADMADVAVKVMTSSPALDDWKFMNKVVPVFAKSWVSRDAFLRSAQSLDDGEFSSSVWQAVGGVNAGTAALLSTVDASDAGVRQLAQKVLKHSAVTVLSDHVAANSGILAHLEGVFTGQPFYTYKQAREFRDRLDSSDFYKIIKNTADSVLDNGPNPTKFLTEIKTCFGNLGGENTRIFRTPTISADLLEDVHLSPGWTKDAHATKHWATVSGKIATKVLTPVSVASDVFGFGLSWKNYYKASSEEAKTAAMAACFSSSLSMTGSLITAYGAMPRNAKYAKPTSKLGLGLIATGVAASFISEAYKGRKPPTRP